jgi:hypothetical protein
VEERIPHCRTTHNEQNSTIRRLDMAKYNEIQKMAKNMGINTFQMKKKDMILAIQRAENNMECFGTSRVEYCQELSCLWRDDCISLNETN